MRAEAENSKKIETTQQDRAPHVEREEEREEKG